MATSTRTGTVDRKRLVKAFGGDEVVARHVEDLAADVIPASDDSTAALAAATTATARANEALGRVDGLGLGTFGPRPPMQLSVQPGQLIEVVRNAAGHVVGINTAGLAVALQILAPKQGPSTPPDDAQSVLAARTFNRR